MRRAHYKTNSVSSPQLEGLQKLSGCIVYTLDNAASSGKRRLEGTKTIWVKDLQAHDCIIKHKNALYAGAQTHDRLGNHCWLMQSRL